MSYVWALAGFLFPDRVGSARKVTKKIKYSVCIIQHSSRSVETQLLSYVKLFSSYMFRCCTLIIVRLAYKRCLSRGTRWRTKNRPAVS